MRTKFLIFALLCGAANICRFHTHGTLRFTPSTRKAYPTPHFPPVTNTGDEPFQTMDNGGRLPGEASNGGEEPLEQSARRVAESQYPAKRLTTGVFLVMNYYNENNDHDLDRETPDSFPAGLVPRGRIGARRSVDVFDLGKDGLLIRPVKAPGKQAIAKLLKQTSAGRHSPRQAATIVNQALRQARDEDRRDHRGIH